MTKTADNLHVTDVSSNHLSLLTWALERQGKNPLQLFSDIGVTPLSANDPIDRVPLAIVIRALAHIQQTSGDPCSGLELYSHMKLSHLNVLGFALSCSSTLLDFFERVRRFSQYLSSAFYIDFEQQDEHYQVTGRWNSQIYQDQLQQIPQAHLLLEAAGYCAFHMMQDVYGEDLPLKALYLPGQPHEKVVAAYAQVARCPIITGGDFLGADIATEIFTQRLPGANPSLARENDQKLVEHLAAIDETDIVHRCEKQILDGISTGQAYSLKEVAIQLGMSERALKQSLKEQDQSFSHLVAHIKKSLAIQHLQEGKMNISQIAYRLGFDSPSNFSRAFRAWTGASPRDYKRSK